eukprot:1255217-Rhodomonas_salina.2
MVCCHEKFWDLRTADGSDILRGAEKGDRNRRSCETMGFPKEWRGGRKACAVERTTRLIRGRSKLPLGGCMVDGGPL